MISETDRTKAAREAKLKRIRAEKAAKKEEEERVAEQIRAENAARQAARDTAEKSRAARARPLSNEERCPIHGLSYFKGKVAAICICKGVNSVQHK